MEAVSGRERNGRALLVCAFVAVAGFHCGSDRKPSGSTGTGGAGGTATGGQAGGAATGGAGGQGGVGGTSSAGGAGAGGTAAAAGGGGAAGAGGNAGGGGAAGAGGSAGAAGAGGAGGMGGRGGGAPQTCPGGASGQARYPLCPGGPCQTNADCGNEPINVTYRCFHDEPASSCASASPGRCLPWIGGNCATHLNTCDCFDDLSAVACTAVGAGAYCAGTRSGPTGPDDCYVCALPQQ